MHASSQRTKSRLCATPHAVPTRTRRRVMVVVLLTQTGRPMAAPFCSWLRLCVSQHRGVWCELYLMPMLIGC